VTTGVTTGNYESTSDWLSTKDIIVATSEKVDSLVRNGADWLSDLTCVVSDEVHLIDDRNRGRHSRLPSRNSGNSTPHAGRRAFGDGR